MIYQLAIKNHFSQLLHKHQSGVVQSEEFVAELVGDIPNLKNNAGKQMIVDEKIKVKINEKVEEVNVDGLVHPNILI